MTRTSPPEPDVECPDLRVDLSDEVGAALEQKHASLRGAFGLSLRTGGGSAYCAVVIGHDKRAHEVELFCRDVVGVDYDGAVGVVVDYLDAIVDRVLHDDEASLPLDWEGRPFGRQVVFVRGEVRNMLAEREAAKLLGEEEPELRASWRRVAKIDVH